MRPAARPTASGRAPRAHGREGTGKSPAAGAVRSPGPAGPRVPACGTVGCRRLSGAQWFRLHGRRERQSSLSELCGDGGVRGRRSAQSPAPQTPTELATAAGTAGRARAGAGGGQRSSGHEGRAGGAGLCQEPQRADCEGTPSAQRAQGKRGDALARSGDRARVGDSFLSGDVRERNSRTARSR